MTFTKKQYSIYFSGVYFMKKICLIMLALAALVCSGAENKKTAEKKPEPKSAPAPAPAPVTVQSPQDDGTIIAAIVAAISAMRSEQGITDGFRVVSFKRGTNKPWNIK